MKIVDRASPNHDSRDGQTIDILLLHYTGMRSADEALERMCDPLAKPGRVSAHYCIDEDGTVYRLVDEDRRAWHAGVAAWAGAGNINARSIGIELVNPGHEFGYRLFPEPQMMSLIALSRDILRRRPIPPQRVLGHSDVAPLRKEDPGELFDWPRLAAAGIGLWPSEDASDKPAPADASLTIAELQKMLSAYGYAVPSHGNLDDGTRAVIRAFQRHFLPDRLTGEPDRETVAQLRRLLARSGGTSGNSA